MNYRHAYHAGNFADVFKHILLVRMLVYLQRKETPLFFLDTHAGSGRYDLADDRASRTGEWRDGIARLSCPMPPLITQLLQPYRDIIGPSDASGRPALYAGSPILAQRLLRAQDRLLLCEIHPSEVLALRSNVGCDRRVTVREIDGYTALKASVPPKERRGLVLIDPPFEVRDEFFQLITHLRGALRQWSTGIYAVWYPLKYPQLASAFANGLIAAGIRKVLRLRLAVGHTDETPDALAACGMIIINPPLAIEDEAKVLLPFLSDCLAQGVQRSWSVDWLAK
jgi:23S rRNA (adenine2030-N6)-methyltransferase